MTADARTFGSRTTRTRGYRSLLLARLKREVAPPILTCEPAHDLLNAPSASHSQPLMRAKEALPATNPGASAWRVRVEDGSSSSSTERREEVDNGPVGIAHLRVALSPERVPRFPVSFSAGLSEFFVQPVHLLG